MYTLRIGFNVKTYGMTYEIREVPVIVRDNTTYQL